MLCNTADCHILDANKTKINGLAIAEIIIPHGYYIQCVRYYITAEPFKIESC